MTPEFLSSETAVVWRPGDPNARPPATSALSGPPHVRDRHDGASPHLPTDRLLIDRAAKAPLCLCLQPDLLNFKKGWMVKLEGSDQVHFCCFQPNSSAVVYVLGQLFCVLFCFLSPVVEEVLVCALDGQFALLQGLHR